MSYLPIDIESETVQLDGQWYTRDELATSIRSMLDAGNFAVAKPSHALEQLNYTIGSLRTLALRVTPDLADALDQAAQLQGRSVGTLVRDAIATYLQVNASSEANGPAAPPREEDVGVTLEPPAETPRLPLGRRNTEPELATVSPQQETQIMSVAQVNDLKAATSHASPAHAAESLPTVVVSLEEPVIGDAEAGLTPKNKEEDSVERRWFGG